MLTRKEMYEGDTAKILLKAINAEYTPAEELVPGLPSDAYKILRRALAKDPEKRYPSCAEMAADIENCLYALEYRPNAKLLSEFMIGLFESQYSEEKEKLSQMMKYAPEKGYTASGTAVLHTPYPQRPGLKSQDPTGNSSPGSFCLNSKSCIRAAGKRRSLSRN